MSSRSNDSTKVFYLLPGEKIVKKAILNNCLVALTNYRLYFICDDSNNEKNSKTSHIGVPLNLILKIEQLEFKNLRFWIKLGSFYILYFENSDMCNEWLKEISDGSISRGEDNLFAFRYYDYIKQRSCLSEFLQNKIGLEDVNLWKNEFKRMNFNKSWKISDVNRNFQICDSYPRYHIVPESISNNEITIMSEFRGNKRFPSVVWRSQKTGAVIIRCAQPQVGLMWWRNTSDEKFFEEIRKCSNTQKLVIIDARHYSAAQFNRIRGGGVEYSEHYGDAEIMFMQLENIHNVRSSFDCVSMFAMTAENWLTTFENSYWLKYVSKLLRAATDIAKTLHVEGRSIIIHCSDGWDRTPQLTSLAQILLDGYYRTIEGFQVLIEKEWIQFGHKFSDRCCIGRSYDSKERSPVFVQWLDCIHQLLKQFPTYFEFNETFLIKLAIHAHSGLFGDFLFNSENERNDKNSRQSTISIWSYLCTKNDRVINPLYQKTESSFLIPKNQPKYLIPWNQLFFESLNNLDSQKYFSLDYAARSQNLTSFQNNSIEDIHEEPVTNTINDNNNDRELLSSSSLHHSLTRSSMRRSKSASNITIMTSVNTTAPLNTSLSSNNTTEQTSSTTINNNHPSPIATTRSKSTQSTNHIDCTRIKAQSSQFINENNSLINQNHSNNKHLTNGINSNNSEFNNNQHNNHLINNNNCNKNSVTRIYNNDYCSNINRNYQSIELYPCNSNVDEHFNDSKPINLTNGYDYKNGYLTEEDEIRTTITMPNLDEIYFTTHQFDDSIDDNRLTASSATSLNLASSPQNSQTSPDPIPITYSQIIKNNTCDFDGIFNNPEPINLLQEEWNRKFTEMNEKLFRLQRQNSCYFNEQVQNGVYKNKPLHQLRADSGSSMERRPRNEDSISSHDSYVLLEPNIDQIKYHEKRQSKLSSNGSEGLILETLQSCNKEFQKNQSAHYTRETNGHEKAPA